MSRNLSLAWIVTLAMDCSIVPMIIALSYWHYEMEYDDLLERNPLKGQVAMDSFAGLVEAGVVNHKQEPLKQAVRSVSLLPSFSRAFGVDKDYKVFGPSWGAGGDPGSHRCKSCFKPATSGSFVYTVGAQ